MRSRMNRRSLFIAVVALVAITSIPTVVSANHQWGNYHWGRTTTSFSLKVGNNLTSNYTSILNAVDTDWSRSVVDTVIVAGNGTAARKCSPTLGRDEVCNTTYGRNGWLGIASIWANGDHITQGTVKMNDTYFAMAQYSDPSWRRMVLCQELGHTFGLDHQDENFSNANLGTCMDYTNAPLGGGSYGLSNLSPNQHDYDELRSIYSHVDTTTTLGAAVNAQAGSDIDTTDPRNWGQAVRADQGGRAILFQRDLGHNNMIFTFVYWAEDPRGNGRDQ